VKEQMDALEPPEEEGGNNGGGEEIVENDAYYDKGVA